MADGISIGYMCTVSEYMNGNEVRETESTEYEIAFQNDTSKY